MEIPVLHDALTGSFHETVGLHEKIWIDPVCAITEIHDVDYSSGLASGLDQLYLVVQNYLGGGETWSSGYRVDFALGDAVCLWQSFEVVQSYLGGAEAWTSSHQVDFALGRAVCVLHTLEIDQAYLGGSETWSGSYGQEFSTGRAACLDSLYHIDQPYVGGNERWPSRYESFFSAGRSSALYQEFEVVQPYKGGAETWAFRWDAYGRSVTTQLFLVGTETTEIAGLGVTVSCVYEFKTNTTAGTAFALDSVNPDRRFEIVSRYDGRRFLHFLATAATGVVSIDTLNGKPRAVDVRSVFEATENRSVVLLDRYCFTETGYVRLPYVYDRANAGRYLLRIQEESYFEYVACLTNIHTGLVTTVTTADLAESVDDLKDQCAGDAEWQLEWETSVRFYHPDRPNQWRDRVLWRFLTKDGFHWKQGPVVSELRAVRLPSFMELHFTADWPYRSLEQQIAAYQFRPTQENDYFDLGVWISDSARIDTSERPVLTIPYASETRNYDVHVPRRESTRYVAVAPIRKYPYEEVGSLAILFIP